MSTYLDFIPSPASIKTGDTEVHTGNPVDQVTITGDVSDFGVVIANQATDGDARITFSNNDRSYTLGLNGVSGSTNEDFRIVVSNNINTGTNVLSANQHGHLTIGRTTLTGGLQLRARTVTANTTLVNDTDHIIFADAASGNIVLTLPANNSNADGSSTVGKEYVIIKTDSSTNTVQIKGSTGTPGDSVNGSTNYLLRSQNETATVVRSTGSSWLVTASNKLSYFGNGSATNPSISFDSDPDTGIYRPGANQFGITTGGASRMIISSAGINVQNHKITNLGTPTANNDAATKAYVDGILTNVPVGTESTPGLAFVGDPDTGIYRPSANQFGITTGGTSRMIITSTGINVMGHRIADLGTPTANSDAATKAYVDDILTNVPAGTVGAAGLAFVGDPNTGIYQPSADQFGITTSGTSRMVISSAGINVQNHKITNLGTPTANSDAATKAYVDSLAVDFTSIPNGTPSSPSLRFVGSATTGLSLSGSGTNRYVTVSTNGVATWHFGNANGTSHVSSLPINMSSTKITSLGTPTANNDAATKAYVDDILTNVPVGTFSAAGLAFVGDPDTGIYRPSVDQFGITTAGYPRMILSSAGINVMNHKIVGLDTPTASSDAATKAYVDGILTNVPVGTASTAGLAFVGDPDTGIYRPNVNQFGITTGGTSRMIISSAGINVMNHRIVGLGTPTANSDAATKAYVDSANGSGWATTMPLGAVATPGLAFTGDANTGLYQPGADQLAISTGGTARLIVSSAGVNVNSNKIINLATPTAGGDAATKAYVDGILTNVPNGTFGAASLAFVGDPDTGIYRPSVDQFGITTGGYPRMIISSAGINVMNHRIVGLDTPTASSDAATKAYVDGILTNVPVGTASTAGLAFVGDPDTGIYRPNVNQFGITTGGTSRMIISSAGINVQNHKITNLGTPTANNDAATKAYVDSAAGIPDFTSVPNGSGGSPSLRFTGDSNSGFYLVGDGVIGVSTNGVSRWSFGNIFDSSHVSSLPIDMNNNKITALGTPTANGDAATKEYVDSRTLAKRQTSTVTINNSATLVALTPSITISAVNGDEYSIRVMIKGTQGNAAANLRVAVRVSGVVIGDVVWEMKQYDATTSTTVYGYDYADQTDVTTSGSAVQFTTPQGANSPFILTGDGYFRCGSTGTFDVFVQGGQASGTVANTVFQRAVITLVKI